MADSKQASTMQASESDLVTQAPSTATSPPCYSHSHQELHGGWSRHLHRPSDCMSLVTWASFQSSLHLRQQSQWLGHFVAKSSIYLTSCALIHMWSHINYFPCTWRLAGKSEIPVCPWMWTWTNHTHTQSQGFNLKPYNIAGKYSTTEVWPQPLSITYVLLFFTSVFSRGSRSSPWETWGYQWIWGVGKWDEQFC